MAVIFNKVLTNDKKRNTEIFMEACVKIRGTNHLLDNGKMACITPNFTLEYDGMDLLRIIGLTNTNIVSDDANKSRIVIDKEENKIIAHIYGKRKKAVIKRYKEGGEIIVW